MSLEIGVKAGKVKGLTGELISIIKVANPGLI
jgi:hypothetical protein